MVSVTLISGEFPPLPGGMGDYTRQLANALAGLGARVGVLTTVSAQVGAHEPFALYPQVERWDFSSWSVVTRHLEAYHPQILHIQYQAAAYGMHPAINLLPWRLRLLGGHPKTLVTFHDLRVPYLFPKAGPLRRWTIAALAKGCDGVIVTNVQDELEAEGYGLQPYLVPIGSNITPRTPPGYHREGWRAQMGVGPEETLLSYFGLLHESKGVMSLLLALARLLGEGERVKLIMVGGKTGPSDPTTLDYARQVERAVGEMGLAGHVLWTGYVSDEEVSANFLASDVCVLPYRDGVSLRRGSLMAALVHGLPIVSTEPRGEVKELEDGQNIALVPPDDPEALAAKIKELAHRASLRSRLGEGAKKLAGAFSWEMIAEETVMVYSSLAGLQ